MNYYHVEHRSLSPPSSIILWTWTSWLMMSTSKELLKKEEIESDACRNLVKVFYCVIAQSENLNFAFTSNIEKTLRHLRNGL